MRCSPTSNPPRAALAAAGLLVAAGCAEEPAPDGRGAPERQVASRPAPEETPARYRTTVAFAAADSSVGLVLRFVQTTASGSLRRRYRGWIGASDGWSSVLALEDTLPVPRARWRVLPAGPLRLEAGAGGEIDGYRLRTPGGAITLRLGTQITSWPSPTGQRDRLRRAALRVAGDTLDGFAVVRRTARPLDDVAPAPAGSLLLLAGVDGGGLAVILPGGTAPPAAHGRLGAEAVPWDSVALSLPAGAEAGRLSTGDGAVSFELRLVREGTRVDDAPARLLTGTGAGGSIRGLLLPAGGR